MACSSKFCYGDYASNMACRYDLWDDQYAICRRNDVLRDGPDECFLWHVIHIIVLWIGDFHYDGCNWSMVA